MVDARPVWRHIWGRMSHFDRSNTFIIGFLSKRVYSGFRADRPVVAVHNHTPPDSIKKPVSAQYSAYHHVGNRHNIRNRPYRIF